MMAAKLARLSYSVKTDEIAASEEAELVIHHEHEGPAPCGVAECDGNDRRKSAEGSENDEGWDFPPVSTVRPSPSLSDTASKVERVPAS